MTHTLYTHFFKEQVLMARVVWMTRAHVTIQKDDEEVDWPNKNRRLKAYKNSRTHF